MEDGLKKLILEAEGKTLDAYTDTTGNPTIGVGANLNSPDINPILKEQGLDRKDLIRGTQSITPEQSESILNAQIDEKKRYYDNIKKRDFPKAQLNAQEEAALMSMMFNNPKLVGPQMRKLLDENNKVEAAREIMLRSNKGGVPGIQYRRMMEAQEFLGDEQLKKVLENLSEEEADLIRERLNLIDNPHHKKDVLNRFPLFRRKK